MRTKLLPLFLIHTTTQQKETTRPLTRSTQATTVATPKTTTTRDPLSLFHSKDQVWEHHLPPRFIRLFLLMSPTLGIAAAATAAALVVVVAVAAAAHPAAPTHATTQVQATVILQSTRVQLGAPVAEVNG